MITTTTYKKLKTLELVESQYDFSQHWLGKGKSYMSAIKAAKRKESVESLTALLLKLQAKAREYELLGELDGGEHVAHYGGELRTLAKQVWGNIRQRCT